MQLWLIDDPGQQMLQLLAQASVQRRVVVPHQVGSLTLQGAWQAPCASTTASTNHLVNRLCGCHDDKTRHFF